MNNRPTLNNEIWNDAGLLREHTVQRYTSFLVCGGHLATYSRVLRLARRISRLAGITLDNVMRDLRTDVEAIHP